MRRLAAMGGSYGNVPALKACLEDAHGADVRAFLGDAIGCCAHSEEVLAIVKTSFDVLVAGNHEQQAAIDSESCGCGYASPEDEAISCEAFRLATEALTPASKAWLGTWPERAFVELEGVRPASSQRRGERLRPPADRSASPRGARLRRVLASAHGWLLPVGRPRAFR